MSTVNYESKVYAALQEQKLVKELQKLIHKNITTDWTKNSLSFVLPHKHSSMIIEPFFF